MGPSGCPSSPKARFLFINSELYLVEGADHVFNVKHPLEEIVLSKELQLVVDKTISFLKG